MVLPSHPGQVAQGEEQRHRQEGHAQTRKEVGDQHRSAHRVQGRRGEVGVVLAAVHRVGIDELWEREGREEDTGQHEAEQKQGDEDHPVEEDVPQHGGHQGPEVRGHGAHAGRQVAVVLAEMTDRLRLAIRRRSVSAQPGGHVLQASGPAHPGRQPAADVTPARHRGEVVELLEHPVLGEALDRTEPERGAADPAPGDAEGAEGPVAGRAGTRVAVVRAQRPALVGEGLLDGKGLLV